MGDTRRRVTIPLRDKEKGIQQQQDCVVQRETEEDSSDVIRKEIKYVLCYDE